MKKDSTVQMMLAGDVELNPGPIKHPCSVCNRAVAINHRSLSCDTCSKRCHIKCGGVQSTQYIEYQKKQQFTWICPVCIRNSVHQLSQVEARAQFQGNNQGRQDSHVEGNRAEDQRIFYDDLKTRLQQRGPYLNIAHINVNGLLTKKKLDEIRILLETTGIDCLGITETKLKNTDKEETIKIKGYKVERFDRGGKK